jgi:integrase
MSVSKECGARGCAYANHRCAHSYVARFKVKPKISGLTTRYVIRVDDFAVTRGGPAHVKEKRDADRWEQAMVDLAKAGGDPRLPPPAPAVVVVDTIKQLLDDYTGARLPALRQTATPRSELKHLRGFFSDADPVALLEDESRVAEYALALRAGWKPDLDAAPGEGRGVIAVNRLLTRWRNVVEWAQGQKPARLTRSPFHAYGMVIKTSEEEPRTRRLHDGEEDALITALDVLDDKQHRYRKAVMERVVRGVIECGLRQSELCRVRTTEIDWANCLIGLPKGKQKAKGQDKRYVPFEPGGALDLVIRPRRFLKFPHNFAFGNDDGTALDANKASAANFRHAWVTVNLTAHGWLPAPDDVLVTLAYKAEGIKAIDLSLRDLRRECASRWWEQGLDLRTIQLLLGHSTLQTTQRYLQLADTQDLTTRLADALGWKQRPSQTGRKDTTKTPHRGGVLAGARTAEGGK